MAERFASVSEDEREFDRHCKVQVKLIFHSDIQWLDSLSTVLDHYISFSHSKPGLVFQTFFFR